MSTRTLSLKDLKVLDSRGNPVIVSAVVTFIPTSAKQAHVDVENPRPNASRQPEVQTDTFLELQAQAVLKQITSQFPYEAPDGQPSLQTEGTHITDLLITTLQRRVNIVGARILSFDLVNLSYAPEIAQSMLVRKQAQALVDARRTIVKGAVEMTSSAIGWLEKRTGRKLPDEAKDQISSNQLTVVCSNESVTPTLSLP